MTPPSATPQVGQPVLCDGRFLRCIDPVPVMGEETAARFLAKGRVLFEDATVRVVALETDLHWSDELGAWYLWGRCLSKADRVLVAELRDRGLLIARTTRMPSMVPAGGEHLDLYLTLVQGKPAGFLEQQLAPVRRGEPPPPALRAAAEDFAARWQGPHTDGYADPDDAPSTDIASQPAGRS